MSNTINIPNRLAPDFWFSADVSKEEVLSKVDPNGFFEHYSEKYFMELYTTIKQIVGDTPFYMIQHEPTMGFRAGADTETFKESHILAMQDFIPYLGIDVQCIPAVGIEYDARWKSEVEKKLSEKGISFDKFMETILERSASLKGLDKSIAFNGLQDILEEQVPSDVLPVHVSTYQLRESNPKPFLNLDGLHVHLYSNKVLTDRHGDMGFNVGLSGAFEDRQKFLLNSQFNIDVRKIEGARVLQSQNDDWNSFLVYHKE